MSDSHALKYRRNWELRHELVAAVVPDRAPDYGPPSGGIVKADLLEIADEIGVTYDESPTLSRLYRDLSEAVGLEYPTTAGQDYALRRDVLKALLREVGD